MSDYFVVDAYPADAIGGGDLLSGAAQRTIVDHDRDGNEYRRLERIVVTSRSFDSDILVEGRVCLSEQTLRGIGAEIGLVDPDSARRLEVSNYQLQARNDQLEAENAALKLALDVLPPLRTVYVLADGTKVGTEVAADERSRSLESLRPATVAPLVEE